jgi:hypothetical protein
MGLDDFACQHQPDTGAAWFGSEAGHKEIFGLRQAWAFVFDGDFHRSGPRRPRP